MRHLWFILTLFGALCATLPATARAQTPERITDLATLGTDEGQFLGVVFLMPKSDGSNQPQTDVRFRPTGAGADRWLQYAFFDARVLAMAQRRGDLAVLIEVAQSGPDRTLLRFVHNDLEPTSTAEDIPGPPVPAGLVLFDIAGGNGEDPMYGLGRSESDDQPAEPLALTNDQWQTLPPLPADVAALPEEDLDLGTAAGRPVVAARIAEDRLAVYELENGAWHDRGSAPLDGDASRRFSAVDHPTLPSPLVYVYGREDHLLRFEAGRPEPQITPVTWTLPEDVSAVLSPGDPRAAAVAVGALRLERAAILGEDGVGESVEGGEREIGRPEVLLELALNARTLEPMGDGQAVALTLSAITAEQFREQLVTLLLYGLLVIAVITVLRQKPPPSPERLRDVAAILAPLSLRLAAGLVDLLPLLMIGGFWYAYQEQLGEAAEWVVIGIGAAVYFGHLILAEWLTGRSLGKAIFGLKVVRTDGGPAGAWPVILRNILRPLDAATFGLTLVMAMFTPLRQRLGDMAAATTVVLSKPSE